MSRHRLTTCGVIRRAAARASTAATDPTCALTTTGELAAAWR